jgi:hypothetical protein
MPETEPEPDVWRCETCVHYRPIGVTGSGYCQPGRPANDEEARTAATNFGRWPVVDAHDSCGEWSDVPPPAVRAARRRATRRRAGGPAMGGAS